jgi:hypothetical protein
MRRMKIDYLLMALLCGAMLAGCGDDDAAGDDDDDMVDGGADDDDDAGGGDDDPDAGGGGAAFCQEECAASDDCLAHFTCLDNSRCGCEGDENCQALFSGWVTACEGDGDCPGQVCIDVSGTGYCATAPTPGAFECDQFGEGWEEVTMPAFEGGGDVAVCANGAATCQDGVCAVEGGGKTFTCPDDFECPADSEYPNCVEGTCECDDDSCTDGKTCVDGFCSCSDASQCPDETAHPGTTYVCE